MSLYRTTLEHISTTVPKYGRWITSPYADNDKVMNYKCSLCGKSFSYHIHTEAKPNYCMNCGARMEIKNGE